MVARAVLTRTAEKKHSVRYDTDAPRQIIRTAYLTKAVLGEPPFPDQVVVTISTPEEDIPS